MEEHGEAFAAALDLWQQKPGRPALHWPPAVSGLRHCGTTTRPPVAKPRGTGVLLLLLPSSCLTGPCVMVVASEIAVVFRNVF